VEAEGEAMIKGKGSHKYSSGCERLQLVVRGGGVRRPSRGDGWGQGVASLMGEGSLTGVGWGGGGGGEAKKVIPWTRTHPSDFENPPHVPLLSLFLCSCIFAHYIGINNKKTQGLSIR
jgi:hypothetical protein